MSDQTKRNGQSKPGDKPFPWRCFKCLKREVNPVKIPYTARVNHDGRLYEIPIPELEIPRCQACGELTFSNGVDEQITQALRAQLHLLTPEQIRSGRKALDLQQKHLAERLGVAEATICRWETGLMIQSRAMDNLLRLYFGVPEVRSALTGTNQDPDLGVTVTLKRGKTKAKRKKKR